MHRHHEGLTGIKIKDIQWIRDSWKTFLHWLMFLTLPMQLMDSSEVGSSEPTPPPSDHLEEGNTPMAPAVVNSEKIKADRETSYSTDSSDERLLTLH